MSWFPFSKKAYDLCIHNIHICIHICACGCISVTLNAIWFWVLYLLNLTSWAFVQMLKYGVVRMHDLIQDILYWKIFYLSGRLQKPVCVSYELAFLKNNYFWFLYLQSFLTILLSPTEKIFSALGVLRWGLVCETKK